MGSKLSQKARVPERTTKYDPARFVGAARLRDMILTDRKEKAYNRVLDIALEPGTSLRVLEILSDFQDSDIKQNVAANQSSTAGILAKLAEDDDKYVRMFAAYNPNISAETLLWLAENEDSDTNVLDAVANRASTPPEALRIISEKVFTSGVNQVATLCVVAQNENTPMDVLDNLSAYDSISVRHHVISNPNVPMNIIERLLDDENGGVRQRSKEVYFQRKVDDATLLPQYAGYPREWVEQILAHELEEG